MNLLYMIQDVILLDWLIWADMLFESRTRIKFLRKKKTIELMKKDDFYIFTTPDVYVKELKNDLLLAYKETYYHAIFNEVTCTILKESQNKILFSDLLKVLQKIFKVDKQILEKRY